MIFKNIINSCKIFATLLSLLTCGTTLASNTLSDDINELMRPWSKIDAPGVAIAVRLDGQLVFENGYGLANLEYSVPMTADTPIQVGSISKQFTAFAALILIASGELSLDADIRTLLPEMNDVGHPVLVRHLLNHMSGLRDESSLAMMAGWQEDDTMQQDQIVKLVSQQKGLNFAPQTEYQYNNSNFLLLAEIVERVSGQPFSDYTREKLFQPLSMDNTYFISDRLSIIEGGADSYYATRSGFSRSKLNSDVSGSTGLITTAKDLMLWAKNFENKQVGNDEVHRLMSERAKTFAGDPAVLAKGQEQRSYLGKTLWCHGGRTGGFRSFLVRIPSKKLAISVLSNRSDFDMAQIAYDILAIVNPKELESSNESPANSDSFDTQTLEHFIGDFMLFKGIIFSFKVSDQTLLFSTNQTDEWTPLKRASKNLFSLNEEQNTFIEFNDDESGMVNSIDYVISKNGRLNAKRTSVVDTTSLKVDLKKYEGKYWSDELNTRYVIKSENGRLFAEHQRLAPIELFLSAENTFDSRSNHFTQIEFILSEDKEVRGVKMSHAVADNIWFYRLKY